MIEEIETMLAEYSRWLSDKTILKQTGNNWVEITTPYLDRHNDCLQIYVKEVENGFVLTDDGYILNDLLNSGCALDTPKRQELLKTTLAGFGVQTLDDQLTLHATRENFPQKKHNIIQSMLAVNDLFYLSSPFVASLFMEDVTKWLELSEIRFTPNIKFTGQSGYDHMFDFVIPKSRSYPERIVQAVSNPEKGAAEALVFKWLDTRETRSSDSKLFVILNDMSSKTSQSVIDALRNYKLEPVLWSEREKAKEMLAL